MSDPSFSIQLRSRIIFCLGALALLTCASHAGVRCDAEFDCLRVTGYPEDRPAATNKSGRSSPGSDATI